MVQYEQKSAFLWASDQLIVDTRYAERVRERLHDVLSIKTGGVESDSNLGLTLLFDLREETADSELADLDSILVELRRGFAAECGGWVPEMGKNRINEVVFPSPFPEIHEGGYPEPAQGPHWPTSSAGRDVRVGIVDTPLVPHDSLPDVKEEGKGKFVHGSSPSPMRAGHSTFVAGLIKAKAPAAKIIVRGGVPSDGLGTLWQAAKEVAAFAEEEIDVLNLSFGCRTADGQPPLIMLRAIEQIGPNTVVVASAGNHGGMGGMVNGVTRKSPVWPAALPSVVAVGAVDKNGMRAAFSPDLPWVNRNVRGVEVVSAYMSGKVELDNGQEEEFYGWAKWSGTSFAAANLTGEIAARIVPGKVTPREALEQV